MRLSWLLNCKLQGRDRGLTLLSASGQVPDADTNWGVQGACTGREFCLVGWFCSPSHPRDLEQYLAQGRSQCVSDERKTHGCSVNLRHSFSARLWRILFVSHPLVILKLSGTSHPFSFASQFSVHRTKTLDDPLKRHTPDVMNSSPFGRELSAQAEV